MSTDTQFLGGLRATKSIGGTRITVGCTQNTAVQLTVVNSGALTAGALSTVLSRTNSAGYLHNFTAWINDTTLRAMGLQITIDGIVVFNQTNTVISTIGNGFCISGPRTETAQLSMPALTWTDSILIEWSSSLSENGKFTAQYMYEELQ